MINKNSVSASLNLAGLFAEQNKVLKPKSGSVVSELVRLSNPVTVSDYMPETNRDDGSYIGEVLSAGSGGVEGAQSEHDLCIDTVVNEISAFIQSHISFAKNVVKPIVVQVVDETSGFLKNEGSRSAESEFCIKVCNLPELLDDGIFVDTVLKHEGKDLFKPDTESFLGSKTDEEIRALLLTGDADIDQQITAWYTRQGEAFFQVVWQSFFAKQGEFNAPVFVSYDDLFSMNLFEKTDYALAIYLLADKLFDNVDETVAGMPLTAYKVAINQIREIGAVCIIDALRRIGSFKTSKMLVVGSDLSKKTISVYGDVYMPWLETNGSAEIILGVLVSEATYRTVGSIDEHHEQLQESWRQHTIFFQANRTLNVFNYFKDALRLAFNRSMESIDPLEKSFIEETPGYLEKVSQILEFELNSLRTKDMDDLFETALKIVCRARFYYTDAENILSDIVQASKSNPNINVREAALIAAVNYISDYVSDQIEVVNF